MTRIAYTIKEAAEVVGLSTDTIRAAIRSTDSEQHLPAKMAGAKYLILKADLEAWINNLPEA